MPKVYLTCCLLLLATTSGCSAFQNLLAGLQDTSIESAADRAVSTVKTTGEVAYTALPQPIQVEMFGPGSERISFSGLPQGTLPQLVELPVPTDGLELGKVATELLDQEEAIRFAQTIRRRAAPIGSPLKASTLQPLPRRIADVSRYVVIRRLVAGEVNDYFFPATLVTENVLRRAKVASGDIVRVETLFWPKPPPTEQTGQISVSGHVKNPGVVKLDILPNDTLSELNGPVNPDERTIAVVSRVTNGVRQHFVLPFEHPQQQAFATLQTRELVNGDLDEGQFPFRLLADDSVAFHFANEIPVLTASALETLLPFLE